MSHEQKNKYMVFIIATLAIFYIIFGAGNSKIRLVEKVGLRLSEDTNTELTDALIYYPISGTFTDGCCSGFILDSTGVMTYTGTGGNFIFGGSSDVKANKVCNVNYTLFKNGQLTNEITPVTFGSANSYKNIGITGLITLQTGDYLQVKACSDAANTTLAVYSLRFILWGE